MLLLISVAFVTAGSPYYDNVRPLCYSDADAVLLCFDISRPDTVESALKKVTHLTLSVFKALARYANLTSLSICSGKPKLWISVPVRA